MNADYFMEGIDDWFDVTIWPRLMRRWFILSLPISAPLYACAFFAMILVAVFWFLAVTIVHAWK